MQADKRNNFPIKVDASCHPIVASLDDDLCTFLGVFPQGLGMSDGGGLSAEGVVAVIFALVIAVLVVLLVVLLVVHIKSRGHRHGKRKYVHNYN